MLIGVALSNPKLLMKECLMVLHVDQMGFLLYRCENPLMATLVIRVHY